jgi:hypothetical protein
MSRTQLYISPNRRGTVTLSAGSISVQGSGTNFTSADNGKTIIFRTSTGDIERKILSANGTTQSLTLNASVPTSQSGVFFYLEYVEVDLYDDIPFTLTYNIADIRNPDKRNGSFSKTVRIPGTDTNNALFGSIFEIDIDGSFNPNIKALAYIEIDTIEQFRGVMQLLQINRTRDFIEYEISVFGSIGSFFNSVGNKQLRDIDLSDYNHIVNQTNITDSWFEQIQKNGSNYDNFTGSVTTQFPNGQPIGEGYTYPLIYDGYAQATGTSINFELPTIRGAVYAKQLVDSIFSSVGFTYTSTFLNSQMFKNLIIPFQRRAKHKIRVQIEVETKINSSNPTIETLAFLQLIHKPACTGLENIIDSITIAGLGSDPAITQNIDIEFEVEYGDLVYLQLDNTQSDSGNEVRVLTGGSITISYSETTDISAVYGNMVVNKNNTDIINTLSVERVQFNSVVSDLENTWSVSTDEHTVSLINLQSNLHANIKQVDYLMSLVKMFNLYIDVDKDDANNLIIEPYNDFMDNDVLDWTMKLDNSRQIEIYPMGELDFRQFLWTYTSDFDIANEKYTAKWSQVYGERTINIDNDFVTQQQKIELVFASTHGIESGSVIISQYFKGDPNKPEPFAQKIRILSHNGKIDIAPNNIGLFKKFNTPTGTSYTYYPQALHLDDAQAPTMDLLFGIPNQVGWKFDNPAIYTTNNLYNKYWSQYISEITDKDSKIVKMWLYLTPQDIRNLDFSAKYFIDNSYYRLNKIENYNPINAQVTKCEFLKIKEGTPFVAGDTDNPIDNLVNYNLVIGGVDEIRNIAADSFYNVVVGGKDEVRSLAATSNIHIIRG